MNPSITQNKSNKTLTQQIFHPGLFNRPRLQSLTDCSQNINNEEISSDTLTDTSSIMNQDTTKWTEAQSRKRPRNSPEADRNQKQSKLSTYWLSQPVPTSNSFSALENDEDKQEEVPQPQLPEKIPKPPPIFIDKVTNIRPLTKLLDETVHGLFKIKILPKDQVKIQPKTSDAYRTIVKELDNNGTEYFTYKPKQDRSFKVILKNMHPSTDTEEIKVALAKLGHNTKNIWNMKQALTKAPLHMFVVELQPSSNNKEVYNIKILNVQTA